MTACAYCGRPFQPKRYTRTGWTRHCSRVCAARAHAGTPLGAQPRKRGRKTQPGATTSRGYGATHQREREAWAHGTGGRPSVDRGEAHCHARVCLMPTRRIRPGEPWDLGHTPDRTAWTGPEHRRCNRADGGRRSPYAHRYHTNTNTKAKGEGQVDRAQPSRTW